MPAQVNIAKFEFDLEADFAPTFADWNTKQIVCYLVLLYESPKHTRNELIIWDKIIKRQSNQKVQLTDAKAKYNVVDVWDGMLGVREARLELRWNVIPWVGLLREHSKVVKEQIIMPEGPPKNVYNYDRFAAK
jgi:signal peptidase complex subunit 3